MAIRNLSQAETLENLLVKYEQKIDLVLKLSVSWEQSNKNLERRTQENRADDSEKIAIKDFKLMKKI